MAAGAANATFSAVVGFTAMTTSPAQRYTQRPSGLYCGRVVMYVSQTGLFPR